MKKYNNQNTVWFGEMLEEDGRYSTVYSTVQTMTVELCNKFGNSSVKTTNIHVFFLLKLNKKSKWYVKIFVRYFPLEKSPILCFTKPVTQEKI